MQNSSSTGAGQSGLVVAEALRTASQRLAASSDTPRLDAELLMAHALGVSRSDMLLRCMQDTPRASFDAFIERRAAHEPVAYIIGTQQFYGLDFKVAPGVLIPRSDSECVVEAALAAAPFARRILDCGTGPGTLLLALLAHVPQAEGVGIDASAAALKLARANAQTLGLADRAQIYAADWTTRDWSAGLGRFDLIVANPPYVELDAELMPDVRAFEPAEALFAGPEGLDDYRILLPQLADLLTPDGVVVLEIGHRQAAPVGEIAAMQGFVSAIQQDLGGRDRAIILRLRLGKAGSRS